MVYPEEPIMATKGHLAQFRPEDDQPLVEVRALRHVERASRGTLDVPAFDAAFTSVD